MSCGFEQRRACWGVLLGAVLALGPGACASGGSAPSEARTASVSCASYKVGEVRNAYYGEIDRIRRSRGGDRVVVRPESPGRNNPEGPTLYTVEIYRYEDSRCARDRRR